MNMRKKKRGKMPERENDRPRETASFSFPPVSTLLDSLVILFRNFRLFLSLFALTTLPLSFLLFSLYLLSHPIESQIRHLEEVAVKSTFTLAYHMRELSRADARSLLRFKAIFFLPCYAFSLIAAITAINSTALACSGKRPSLDTALKAVRVTWKRPLTTSICAYAIMLTYVQMQRMLAEQVSNPDLRFIIHVVGSGPEVYLMVIVSLAIVVSIAEDRFGWDALKAGSGLLAGRRVSGWVLSGLFVLVSGVIGLKMEGPMDDGDLWKGGSTAVVLCLWSNMGLICLYGLVMLWSFVVTTVFYFECRGRQAMKDEIQSRV